MYLYHFVPQDQIGGILYPLNQLKSKQPELYKQHFGKYDDIKEKDVEIPGFGYWNDCINLMPVNPGLVKSELEKFGHDTNWKWKFYKIDASELHRSKLIIMVPTDGEDTFSRKFIKFDQENFDKYCHISEVTKYRFQKAKDLREQPNTFAGIPHVLYKDFIETKNLETIML